MKLLNLSANQLNQNGYSKNMQTKGKIGALFAFPINHTPDDCLSCDGYSLLIVDYKDLFKLLGKTFNQLNDPEDTFRVPDYNITGRFLQPNSNVGIQKDAGLPNIIGYAVIGTNMASGYGAFYTTKANGHSTTGAGSYYDCLHIDASRYSSIYGNSDTVQPPSQTIHLCIKYK